MPGGSPRATFPYPVVETVLGNGLMVVAIPLAITSQRLTQTTLTQSRIQDVIGPWARAAHWTVVSIDPVPDGMLVHATGPLRPFLPAWPRG